MELPVMPTLGREKITLHVRELAARVGSARAWVEYVGRTALVVTGPYTGARYSFDQPGARLEVDVRDRHAILSVPVLRGVAA